MADFFAFQGPPGFSEAAVTTERWALWGTTTWYLLKSIHIVSTAADAGNTPTTELRHGLLMGEVTASKKHKEYNPTGTDGSQFVDGFLWVPRKMIDTDGNATDRSGQLCVAGPVKAGQLLLLDEQARRQMHGRFIFDDRLFGSPGGFLATMVKTANYNVSYPADNNVHFTTRGAAGAVTFTLPALAAANKGVRNRFTNEADQNMTITAPAGKLVTFNNLAATSVALSTAGQKIGGSFEIVLNDDASKYIAIPHLQGHTVTVA